MQEGDLFELMTYQSLNLLQLMISIIYVEYTIVEVEY